MSVMSNVTILNKKIIQCVILFKFYCNIVFCSANDTEGFIVSSESPLKIRKITVSEFLLQFQSYSSLNI